jgi:2,4-dienoyl-CoA reductase (NADPH2)
MSRYRYLFTPLRLGPVVVPNRVVFSAHLTNYAEDGRPSAQHAAYYAARAAGGAGLIITEEHSTHPTDWPYEKLIHGFHPEVIPGYRAITEAVHRHGTPIFAQINHNGGQGSGMYSRLPVWAPSPVADPLFREVPKEVDRSEIAEIVAGYALVAGPTSAPMSTAGRSATGPGSSSRSSPPCGRPSATSWPSGCACAATS